MRFTDDAWDPVAEEEFWRETLKAHRAGLEAIEQKLSTFSTSGFYLNLLAEFDAAVHFTRPECFVSRAAFVAELRRLMIEPPTPSRPVPSLEEYQHAQRTLLQSAIKRYDTTRDSGPRDSALFAPYASGAVPLLRSVNRRRRSHS